MKKLVAILALFAVWSCAKNDVRSDSEKVMGTWGSHVEEGCSQYIQFTGYNSVEFYIEGCNQVCDIDPETPEDQSMWLSMRGEYQVEGNTINIVFREQQQCLNLMQCVEEMEMVLDETERCINLIGTKELSIPYSDTEEDDTILSLIVQSKFKKPVL